MQFDKLAEIVKRPDAMKSALLEEHLRTQLRKVLGELNQELARDPEVIVYILLYLEHAVVGEKKGIVRKQIAMNVLAPYFVTDNEKVQLSKLIDYVVAHDLVQHMGCLKMAYKTLLKWFQFKIR